MSESEQHKKYCDCGHDEFYFAKDLNLDKVWKAGNKYARICTDCGNRYFLSKAMYRSATDQYVILNGEDEPVAIFTCPACKEQVTGQPDTCPYCDVDYEWPDDDEGQDQGQDQGHQGQDEGTPEADSDASQSHEHETETETASTADTPADTTDADETA